MFRFVKGNLTRALITQIASIFYNTIVIKSCSGSECQNWDFELLVLMEKTSITKYLLF